MWLPSSNKEKEQEICRTTCKNLYSTQYENKSIPLLIPQPKTSYLYNGRNKTKPKKSTCNRHKKNLNLKKKSKKTNYQTINTNTYILMFKSPKLPAKLKIGYIIVKVDTYVSNPLWCYNCQKFGQH